MKKIALMVALVSQVVLAQNAEQAKSTEDANLGRNLAASCANCHGTEGRTVSASKEIASLAGENKEKLLSLLLAFKSGQKPSTVMQQIASGYTDQQLERIATWFAAQKNHNYDQ